MLISRARATVSQATVSRLFGQSTLLAAAVGAFLVGTAPVDLTPPSASGESAAIASDPNAKSARDAKRAERAAAREAKKKERAAKKNQAELAKAKSGKSSSGSSVDLGDNDPLEGL